MRFLFFPFLLAWIFPVLVSARGVSADDLNEKEPVPWFTGPLFASSGNVVQKGHYNVEPYFYAIANTSYYNSNWQPQSVNSTEWLISSSIQMQVGVTSWLDFQTTPSFQYDYFRSAAKWTLNDLPIQFDFQILNGSGWIPSIRGTIAETIPIGPYRNLNPQKLGTDQGGLGSWTTSFEIVFANLIHLSKIYFINWRLNLSAAIPAPVHVKGFNAYGGGYGTNGTAYPGKQFSFDFGIEINLSQNWALACDILGDWTFSGRFSGVPGFRRNGSLAANVQPPSTVYSVAPAIEYNWSDSLGVIAGWWGSFSGKNTKHFSSFVLAVNYYK